MHLGTFIAMSLRGNVHVCLGCTLWSPEIGTVLHRQPPDVHTFDTDPSQKYTMQINIHIRTHTVKIIYRIYPYKCPRAMHFSNGGGGAITDKINSRVQLQWAITDTYNLDLAYQDV